MENKTSATRLYFVPAVFTLGAVILWWRFREQEFSFYWLLAIALIFFSQWGLYLKRKRI